jgi:hypothetical protein
MYANNNGSSIQASSNDDDSDDSDKLDGLDDECIKQAEHKLVLARSMMLLGHPRKDVFELLETISYNRSPPSSTKPSFHDFNVNTHLNKQQGHRSKVCIQT